MKKQLCVLLAVFLVLVTGCSAKTEDESSDSGDELIFTVRN